MEKIKNFFYLCTLKKKKGLCLIWITDIGK